MIFLGNLIFKPPPKKELSEDPIPYSTGLKKMNGFK